MRFLKLGLLVCMNSVLVFASSFSSVDACGQQTLSAYMAMTGPCIIGRLAFSNFGYHPASFGDGTALTADQIMVDPLTNMGDPGLKFAASWTASGQGGEDSGITYEVTVLAGQPLIDSAILGMTFNTDHSTVLVSAKETICLGGGGLNSCPAGDIVTLDLDNLAGTPLATTSTSFAPQTAISVLDDIFIKGESINANGAIGTSTNNSPAPAVPEPTTPVLGLSGLLVMWQLARRRPTH